MAGTSGLSPRRRGNRDRQHPEERQHGSIPAQAGEPDAIRVWASHAKGLSPRRRGNRDDARRVESTGGSIPAQAGEPGRRRGPPGGRRVYPRAGGGTGAIDWLDAYEPGLSPRRRGNPTSASVSPSGGGSIPAQAGEPRLPCGSPDRARVYPRAGGGTCSMVPVMPSPMGLSPRRRGNPDERHPRAVLPGSIPAQAGEPRRTPSARSAARVYPRAGGGTRAPTEPPQPDPGLSPRRRGNRRCAGRGGARGGSIPAQAGEPSPWASAWSLSGVYPRAGGGTSYAPSSGAFTWGLSPRRRGNHPQEGKMRIPNGSIPAQAGEPPPARRLRPCTRVYPRAGGGTARAHLRRYRSQGLSPRRRGNPRNARPAASLEGSIPAQAGEPASPRASTPRRTVYPRAGGGTVAVAVGAALAAGLSPRRRGNRDQPNTRHDRCGSIPAQAGEPLVANSLNCLQCQRT